MQLTLTTLLFQRRYRQPWYEEIFYDIINGNVISIVVAVLLLAFIISLFKKTLKEYHSRWNTLINDFEFSSQEFYTMLREELKSHGVTDITIETKRFSEGAMLSGKRLYLKVKWRDYQYFICGAPFGNGFFVSWWLFYRNPILKIIISKLPFIGGWLARKLYPVTFYKIDTASMFMTYAHQSVLTIIERITKDKGTRALTELESKPVLNNIFKR